ncbi:MAG: zf-HC2 domain-containing protein [Eubacteriales bacterium]|nr:zf-HC2 domain-containing protein [Eubacteriales bacterium]
MKIDKLISRSRKIDCREAESMMEDYLNGRLSDRDLPAFWKHLETCSHCLDALETDFMIERTVQYLNEDAAVDRSYDLTPLLRADMEENKEKLLRRIRRRNIRRIITFLTILLLALLVLDLLGIFRITVSMDQLLRGIGI